MIALATARRLRKHLRFGVDYARLCRFFCRRVGWWCSLRISFQLSGLARQAFRGDTKSARDMHLKLLPVFKDLFIEPNPVPAKTALSWRGVMSADCRLPLCEMTAANQARLRKTLEAFEGGE